MNAHTDWSRAGRDAGDTLAVLVVGRAGDRPAGRHVGRLEDLRVRPRQVGPQPEVDEVHRPARRRGEGVHRLAGPEGDGGRRPDGRVVHLAGVGVDAARQVDRHHRHPLPRRRGEQPGPRLAHRAASGKSGEAFARHWAGGKSQPGQRRTFGSQAFDPPEALFGRGLSFSESSSQAK